MTTLFFFGSLRDRELLEVVLGRPVASEDRRGAVALGYQARTLAAEAYPHLAPTPGNRADGIVVSNLTGADLDRLIYFEEAEYGLAPIDVQTDAGVVSAQYFQATAKAVPTDDVWDFDAWTRNERDTALAAAEELMAHKGLVPLEEMDTIWPGVMIRAFMRARAKSEKPVRGNLRGAWTRNDVQSISVTRPYTHYFAIEDHTLRHRRFDGSWSPEIRRTALTSGDAVTVLPFDPLSGNVLLIEQFRAPVFARGDNCPWGIEVIAGRIDKGLDAEAAARAEAEEEGGVTLGRMEQIAAYYPTPGIASEHITSFVAEADLAQTGGLHGLVEEAEDIRAFTVTLEEALAGVTSGEINNAPAILSLQWLQLHAQRLQEAWRGAA